jgi:hypothetical protein
MRVSHLFGRCQVIRIWCAPETYHLQSDQRVHDRTLAEELLRTQLDQRSQRAENTINGCTEKNLATNVTVDARHMQAHSSANVSQLRASWFRVNECESGILNATYNIRNPNHMSSYGHISSPSHTKWCKASNRMAVRRTAAATMQSSRSLDPFLPVCGRTRSFWTWRAMSGLLCSICSVVVHCFTPTRVTAAYNAGTMHSYSRMD